MLIRPEQPGDETQIRSVVVAAFGSEMEGDLVAAIRASPEYEPSMALVAVESDMAEGTGARDVIVGHVMISRATLHSDDSDRPIMSLSPLAVTSSHRRRGIGSALVRTAVDEADARGEPLVVLEGNPKFYGRLGFRHSVPLGIHIELPDWAPPEAAQVLCLEHFDPAYVGTVVYSDAFRHVLES